jgi:hypothetical protein
MIDGQNVLMTSIVFPLMVNGKLIASLSVDINLNSLQAISQGPASSSTTARPRSASSARPAARRLQPDASKLSQRLDRRHRQRRRAGRMLAASSKIRSLHTSQQLKVLSPFQPIPGGKPWGVLLDVPEKVLVGPAETLKAATGRGATPRHPDGTQPGPAGGVDRPAAGVADGAQRDQTDPRRGAHARRHRQRRRRPDPPPGLRQTG